MIDFGGERVVITGAGGGVGQALVDVFSATLALPSLHAISKGPIFRMTACR